MFPSYVIVIVLVPMVSSCVVYVYVPWLFVVTVVSLLFMLSFILAFGMLFPFLSLSVPVIVTLSVYFVAGILFIVTSVSCLFIVMIVVVLVGL